MSQQLLWIEILLKGGIGIVLLAAPRTLARLLGLPNAEEAFWPRLLGATLLGLVAAMAVELWLQPGRGLGVAGLVAVNLTIAGVIGGLLILGKAGSTRRGRWFLGLGAATLTLVALVAIVSAL